MEEPRTSITVGVVVLEALGWSVLSALLAAQGHSPSGPPLLPIEPAGYYGIQAWFAPVVVLVSFGLQTLVAGALIDSSRKAALTIASIGVSVPTLVFWVCGDLVAFSVGGFESLSFAARVVVPLALLGQLVLVGVLAKRHGASTKRSMVVAFALLVTRGMVFGPFMR